METTLVIPWEKLIDYGITGIIVGAVLLALWNWLPKIGAWGAKIWEQQMAITQKLALSMETVSGSMKDIANTLDEINATLDRVLDGHEDMKDLIKNQRRTTSSTANGKRKTPIRGLERAA